VADGLQRVEEVMGMPVGIDVRDDGVDRGALDRAFDWLRWVDATFSTYRADSEVCRLNAGTLALAGAAPEVREVLARCEALRARTRGCFDVRARGPLDPSAFV
jgi:thiamine biosynthesis lipoprotein